MTARVRRALIALGSVIALVLIGVIFNSAFGLPFDTTLRVACAALCLLFIFKLRSDYPGERWPRTSLWIALLVNISLFFTPIFDRPASRGEIMIFALPDAIVVLTVRIFSYPVADAHQRAMRQQMIFGLIVAIVFSAVVFGLTLVEPTSVHR